MTFQGMWIGFDHPGGKGLQRESPEGLAAYLGSCSVLCYSETRIFRGKRNQFHRHLRVGKRLIPRREGR